VKFNYFDSEGNMQELTVDELTKGKKVPSCAQSTSQKSHAISSLVAIPFLKVLKVGSLPRWQTPYLGGDTCCEGKERVAHWFFLQLKQWYTAVPGPEDESCGGFLCALLEPGVIRQNY